MAYDPSTDIGKVRLQVGDTGEVIFSDAEISSFLEMADGSIRRAAALGLRAMAASYAQLARKIKSLDIDATFASPKELIEMAQSLEAEDDNAFDFAEPVYNAYSRIERIEKELERNGGL